jgi:predicted small secreted protein
MKFWMLICASVFALATLSGCNTVEGFGTDVKKGGEKIEDAADRRQ